MKTDIEEIIKEYMSKLGTKGGKSKSKKKAAASRLNGKKNKGKKKDITK